MVESWKLVDEEWRNELWAEVKQVWGIKGDKGKLGTLKKMNSSWRGFKSDLITEYLKKDRNPWEMYSWVKPNIWEQFKRQKLTPEFEALSEKNKEIQRKNDHPHRLGSRGYPKKEKEWKKTVRQPPEALKPILAVRDKRCRNFLFARTIISKDGSVQIPEDTLALAHAIVEKQQDEDFVPDRQNDVLTASLGTKEHPGRIRGLGSTVTWKLWYQGTPKVSKRKPREWRDMNALKAEIRAEMQAEMHRNMQEYMSEMRAEVAVEVHAKLQLEQQLPSN